MGNFFAAEGNLGNSPTLKYIPFKKNGVDEQKPMLEFDVRFNVDKVNKTTGAFEDTGGFWATVEFWGKRAEHYNRLLQQGARVLVVGQYSQGSFVATKGEREGQTITTNTIVADHIGLVLLGVENVTYTPRKNKSHVGSEQQAPTANQQYGAESYGHAADDIPLPSDEDIPVNQN